MDWNKLKAFYEVAVNKSISKAIGVVEIEGFIKKKIAKEEVIEKTIKIEWHTSTEIAAQVKYIREIDINKAIKVVARVSKHQRQEKQFYCPAQQQLAYFGPANLAPLPQHQHTHMPIAVFGLRHSSVDKIKVWNSNQHQSDKYGS